MIGEPARALLLAATLVTASSSSSPAPTPALTTPTPAPIPSPTPAPTTPAPIPSPTPAPTTPAPMPSPTPAPTTPAPTPKENSCDIVKYGNVSIERWVYIDGKKHSVVVEWSTEAEGAAGALLVSALRLAGYRTTGLRRDPNTPPLSLSERSEYYYKKSELLVLLAGQWSAGDVWQGWLRAVGAGVTPVAPRLHRRCLHRDEACYATDTATTTTTANATATHKHKHIKLYVADEWNRTQSNESTSSVDRRTLLDLIQSNDSEPFMFLDVEVWSDVPNVVEVMPASGVSTVRAVRVAHYKIWLYSPMVWRLVSYFQPRREDLRHLLMDPRKDPMVAVCEWAATSPHILDQLHHWAHYLNNKGYIHFAYVYLCTDTENDRIHDYYHLLHKLQDELNSNITIEYHIILRNISIKCGADGANGADGEDGAGGEDAATIKINELKVTEMFRRTIGVIGLGPIFNNVTFPENFTVMSYSTYGDRRPKLGTTSGRTGTIVRALRELLAACQWNRLAVLSERGPVATELSAALSAADDLNLRDVQLTSNRTDHIRDVLETLMACDARIFLVNAGARLAGEVMRVVKLTAAHTGRVWLVREWIGAADAAAPYELTFAWRGGDASAAAAGAEWSGARSPLWDQLSDHWAQRGSWPLYAAPLADAVLALGKGYQQILKTHQNFFDDVQSASRSFWNLSETQVISRGVVQKLQFKSRELMSPRVFLYRWNGTRAALVGDWYVGVGVGVGVGGKCPLPAPPAPRADGSRDCVVHVGERFDQHCADWGLLAGVLALMALISMLVIAVIAARRAVRTRDAQLVKRTEEMLEARWRAKASRLEPYFVERRALKLREQIGAGRFGRVWLGFLREPGAGAGAGGATEGGPVAAKALREDAAPVEETEFFREARALAALQHEHVVRFVGVCVTDGPPLLLMEYAFFGDLLRYLRARRHLVATDSPEAAQVSAEALTRFARQAATALAYLARRGFVHRDVRAANCLVDERRSLKLADFGMARATRSADGAADGDGDGEYTSRRRALFPVLWMAPESLSRGVFSAASDVWALGVLALELVTLGARPYGSLSPLQVHHIVVMEGRRPPLPRELAVETRAALVACWRRAPGERPTAGALAAWLAAQPCALQPAPHAASEDRADDVDSGIGEPRSRSRSSTSLPPALMSRSSYFDDVVLYDDDASFS